MENTMTNNATSKFPRLAGLARRNRLRRFQDLFLTAAILIGFSAGATVAISQLSTIV